MNSSEVFISRTVVRDGVSITETAIAHLPDDLTLDTVTEALRRQVLAQSLWAALPPLYQPCSIPDYLCPPTNLPN